MKVMRFGFKRNDDDEDDETLEEMKEEIDSMMKMARRSRRRMLKNGDSSREKEHPLERIHDRVSFALGENQEDCEKRFGEEFFVEHSFTDGSLWWLSEMGDDQRIFLLLGVMMSICDAETMINMVKSLKLDEEIFMGAATGQMEHLKEHQEDIKTAIVEAVEDTMNPDDILDEAQEHLFGSNEGGSKAD